MERERVILLLYHGTGHFNACFRIAKILEEKYDVIFAGFHFHKNYVEGQGFPFFPLNTLPFGLGFERWQNTVEKNKNISWRTIRDRWSDRLYHLREQELTTMLDAIRPSHLLIDSWQSTDFIVLYRYLKAKKIKTGFVQTMLSSRVQHNKPPLNSTASPTDGAATEKALRNFYRTRLRKRLLAKLKFVGMDNESMVSRRIRLNRIPEKYLSKDASIFSPAFDNIPEFILNVREFDFENSSPLPHQYFVGPMLDETRIETMDENWQQRESEIFGSARQRPLIYCSFGTLTFESEVKKIQAFLRELSGVVQKNNYVCAVSCANPEVLESSNNVNMYFFRVVPQMRVLQHTRLFITHGGLNSIKEGIDARVPMLVIPINTDYDLPGNATRIVHHQLGLMYDISKEDGINLDNKISELLSASVYLRNLEAFSEHRTKYTDENFLSLFEKMNPVE